MNTKIPHALIPLDRIDHLLQIEPFVVILSLAAGAWLIYKFFLRDTSEERHRNLLGQFKNLAWHIATLTAWGFLYLTLTHLLESELPIERLTSYLGLMTLIQGAVVFVKTARILIFEYLFLSHMRVAVPLLLVNLFTLILTLGISAWMFGEVFSIRLAPLLATSAAFSLVLGLALQDTLGNLFAGVALQVDKPYEMGDWVEIQNGGQKWVGQVYEISWRATVLLGFLDETITVPNRIIAQSQVATYATRERPIARVQLFRLAVDAPLEKVKMALYEAAQNLPGLCATPKPLVLIAESSENWTAFKLVYSITEFGSQYIIADRVIEACLKSLEKYNLPIAMPRVAVHHPSTAPLGDLEFKNGKLRSQNEIRAD